MRPLDPMRVDAGVYCGLLAQQLRLAGLAEARVVEVVHDVMSHGRVTGEDPVEAFGQPADYAAQWAAPPSMGSILLRLLVRLVAATALVVGITALLAGGAWTHDVGMTLEDAPGVVPFVVVVAVLPWTLELWLVRRAGRSVGRGNRVPDWVVRGLVVGALMVLFGGAAALLPDPGAGRASILDAPRWLLVLVGSAGAVVVLRQDVGQNAGVPKPPGSRPTLWSRVRGLGWTPGRRP
ncbi:hypothetical protein [Phycicoccus avicenniae]|uniref:hypothetical protein n=1 Tax=Phycicoccus avicenniae TaxID=2828860 RepID=UPI003D291D04